jgi:multiple sugar transport system substrate-binding protein
MARTYRRPLVVLLAGAALALAACSSGGSASPSSAANVPTLDPNQKVTINWWTGQTADAETLLEGLAAEYEKAHPNVTINVSTGASTTDGLLPKMQAGFASNNYPDISYAYGSWATELGQSGKTLDITSNVAQPDVNWSDFPKSAQATATVDGKVIGFPAVVDNLGLIYNKDLFDAAGVAYPTKDWTWDDFRAAAKALTDPSKKIFGTAYPVNGSEDTTWRFWPQLWQNGGSILSSDGQTAAFNSQAGVDALTYWQQLAVDDKSVYLDETGTHYEPLFENNAIGMLVEGPWLLYDLNKNNINYGITILPGTNGDHQTISGPDIWALFNHDDTQRAAAAYDFTNWLTSPAQDVRWNVYYGNLPLRHSEGSLPAFKKYVKTYPGADIFFANLANAIQPRPTVPGYVGLSSAVADAIDKALVAGDDPKQVLDEAATKANLELQG